MAVHTKRGASMIYRWRWGSLTPTWLDRAETPLSRWLNYHLNVTLRLTRSTYIPAR